MNIKEAELVIKGSVTVETSFHQGAPGHKCSPPMPVMVACVRLISTTLSANHP